MRRNRKDADGRWQERQHDQVRASEELNVAVGLARGRVQGVKRLHGGDDEHDGAGDDRSDEKAKAQHHRPSPAEVGVIRLEQPLSEEQVGDENDDDACLRENICSDANADIGGEGRPDYAHAQRGYAQHTEREEQAAEEKFMATMLVDLKDNHVQGGGEDPDDEQCAADVIVDREDRLAAHESRGRRVRRSWRL